MRLDAAQHRTDYNIKFCSMHDVLYYVSCYYSNINDVILDTLVMNQVTRFSSSVKCYDCVLTVESICCRIQTLLKIKLGYIKSSV